MEFHCDIGNWVYILKPRVGVTKTAICRSRFTLYNRSTVIYACETWVLKETTKKQTNDI
jgi:uncharacterized protein YchJ